MGSSFTSSVSGTCFTKTMIFILFLSQSSLFLSQHGAADEHAEDLVGALAYLKQLGVADEALHVVLLAVAVAAEDLLALEADLRAVDAGEELGLRGLEGVGAAAYFSVLDDMILQGKETFFFRERSRRPPLDAFNALLSFAYSLLAHDCAAALESVGLDAYVGYLHRDRPGRESLALDLMEELRPCFADRFVLTLINNRVLKVIDFDFRESGAVLLTDTGRRTFLQKWQERKKETITHPFLEEKIPWGLVPYVQSLLLARYLRGDLDDYPPFLWK